MEYKKFPIQTELAWELPSKPDLSESPVPSAAVGRSARIIRDRSLQHYIIA